MEVEVMAFEPDPEVSGAPEIVDIIELEKITRLSIRTQLGSYEYWADSWEFCLGDNDRTLRLFGRGEGRSARTQRDMELAAKTREDQIRMHERMQGLTEGQEPE